MWLWVIGLPVLFGLIQFVLFSWFPIEVIASEAGQYLFLQAQITRIDEFCAHEWWIKCSLTADHYLISVYLNHAFAILVSIVCFMKSKVWRAGVPEAQNYFELVLVASCAFMCALYFALILPDMSAPSKSDFQFSFEMLGGWWVFVNYMYSSFLALCLYFVLQLSLSWYNSKAEKGA